MRFALLTTGRDARACSCSGGGDSRRRWCHGGTPTFGAAAAVGMQVWGSSYAHHGSAPAIAARLFQSDLARCCSVILNLTAGNDAATATIRQQAVSTGALNPVVQALHTHTDLPPVLEQEILEFSPSPNPIPYPTPNVSLNLAPALTLSHAHTHVSLSLTLTRTLSLPLILSLQAFRALINLCSGSDAVACHAKQLASDQAPAPPALAAPSKRGLDEVCTGIGPPSLCFEPGVRRHATGGSYWGVGCPSPLAPD